MSKYLLIDSSHQLIVKCCYSMECLRKVWSCMRRSLHLKQIRVSCRFCHNSFRRFYQPPCAPEEKFLVDMGEESPGIRVKFWNSLLLEIMVKLMKMRVKGRHRRWGCRCCFWCSRVGDLRVWVALFQFLRGCPQKTTGRTDFVWGCFWHRSTSAMWIFKSSYLISFWFVGIIWLPSIFSKS